MWNRGNHALDSQSILLLIGVGEVVTFLRECDMTKFYCRLGSLRGIRGIQLFNQSLDLWICIRRYAGRGYLGLIKSHH